MSWLFQQASLRHSVNCALSLKLFYRAFEFQNTVSTLVLWFTFTIKSAESNCCCCCVASVMSNSVQPHGLQPTRLLRPWDSPGKNTGVGCHFLLQCMKVESEIEVAQSCLTLSDPMDCSLPGSSVHGIFQARVLEWLPLPSPIENNN